MPDASRAASRRSRVAQLVIAAWPVENKEHLLTNLPHDVNTIVQASAGHVRQTAFIGTMLCGLAIALSMLHSHVSTYPSTPERHAAGRGDIHLTFFLCAVIMKARATPAHTLETSRAPCAAAPVHGGPCEAGWRAAGVGASSGRVTFSRPPRACRRWR